MRARLGVSCYLGFVGLFAWWVCVTPGQGLAFSGVDTGYARIIAQADAIANAAFNKGVAAQAVSQAATAAGGSSSVAVRFVAGLGWAGLAVAAGLTLYQVYLSQQQVEQITQAATPPPGYSLDSPPSVPMTAAGIQAKGDSWAGCATCAWPDQYDAWYSTAYQGCPPTPASGYQDVLGGQCGTAIMVSGAASHVFGHLKGQANPMTYSSGGPPSPQQVQHYVQSLPSTDPNAVDNPANLQSVGGGSPSSAGGATAPQPQPAGQVTTIAVDPGASTGQVPTKLVPKGQVQSTDIVVDPNATPPSGTQRPAVPATQSVTINTTSTQNPDGSTTTQQQEQTSAQCAVGTHSPRTAQAVYDAHAAKWKGTSLLQQVAVFQTLVWPTALPVIALPSAFFGTFTVDFNQWAWFFTALRTMVIACATFYSYRLIFAGR